MLRIPGQKSQCRKRGLGENLLRSHLLERRIWTVASRLEGRWERGRERKAHESALQAVTIDNGLSRVRHLGNG